MTDQRAMLLELYAAAIDAAQPGPAVTAALADTALNRRVHIIAIGKAAAAMAAAGAASVEAMGHDLAGGIVVSTEDAIPQAAVAGLRVLAGDHPAPGERSVRAASAIADATRLVEARDSVLVLLSGGATSLAAAPVPGITLGDLVALNETLLAAGLDIAAVNRVRKRFLQWGAGRLAQALAPADVRCLIASDVIGDDIAAIGSGPCVPDDTRADEVTAMLNAAPIDGRVPSALLRLLADTSAGRRAETPGRDNPAFAGAADSEVERRRSRSAPDREAADAVRSSRWLRRGSWRDGPAPRCSRPAPTDAMARPTRRAPSSTAEPGPASESRGVTRRSTCGGTMPFPPSLPPAR